MSAWGSDSHGQCGRGGAPRDRCAYGPCVQTPQAVARLPASSQIAAGYYNTYALDLDGVLWGFGANGVGQLGDGSMAQRLAPTRVGTGRAPTSTDQILPTGGGQASCLLTVQPDGSIFGSGANGYGQLGNGQTANMIIAGPQPSLGTDNAAVALGLGHTILIKQP